MKSRAMLTGVVLSSALVSGGWLVERGLVGGEPATREQARMFEQVLQHVERDFVDTLSDSAVYRRAAEGLVEELHDPHSTFLSARLLAQLAERTSGRYVGVGTQIDIRDGWITVVAPLPGGPAQAAGIETGDRIVEVNGSPIRGVSVEEAQKALRGEPGTTVRLTIERPGVAAPLKFALTRSEIHIQSAQHATMLRDGVGYVALTIFSEASARDLRRAIDSLRTAGMRTLIFDLRRDPGGLLEQGVGVADLFLDPGQRIVTMRGRTPDATRVFADRAPQPWPQLPVAVLVDSNTASASEIVAGALQDHDRAIVLGTTSYGKGSAQNVFPVAGGAAVKLTTALWYTPSGRSINRKTPDPDDPTADTTRSHPAPRYHTDAGRTVLGGGGITPDVILPAVSESPADSTFDRALGKQIPQFRDALTDYALSLKGSKAMNSPDFTVTPAMRAELLRRMQARGITVDPALYNADAPLIDRLLGYEIARYVFGETAEFTRRLRDDPAVEATLQLVRGASTQQELLRRASSAASAAKTRKPAKP
jgi:carboxyl-terminal processing protease